MDSKPTYEQAQLHLQVFDMRREAKLREARDWFAKNYFIQNFEEAFKQFGPGSQFGTYSMMVAGYWDQTCALLNYGLLHEELFFSTTGEFYMVWDRLKPMVEGARKTFSNKDFLGNLEKAAKRYEQWIESRNPGHLEAMRQLMSQMRPQAAGTAARAS
ncbi:MAG TPA: hypothetical protein VFO34_09400 [Candidatus Acidoferrales bacterium]|nr:hypothetical protein [Candidatus Acidoferrales bacterium]